MKSIPSTNPSAIRWGIVGPGKIAHKFARDLQVAGNGRLRAVAGRNLERARDFANQFGADLFFDDARALAADSLVDVVYIAVPHHAHFEVAKMLLEAGKPVLCEKPMTVNARQAGELIAISRARGVLLMEALWTRFLPVYAQVREWLDDGRIGSPQVMSSAFCVQPEVDFTNRFFNPELAGGGLLDVGVYSLAISQLVMGRKPDQVAAAARFCETGVDEMLSASLRYPNGGVAQFTCGLRAAFDNSLVIGGEKGFIRVPSRFSHATEAFLSLGGKIETFREERRGEGFEYQIEEVMRCLRACEIESPLLPHADTLATMETVDEILQQIVRSQPDRPPPAEGT